MYQSVHCDAPPPSPESRAAPTNVTDVPPVSRDAERTRAELLAVATEVFAEDGYSGARVDDIAERTRTTKRMIYYYFGGKEGLYLAVLEESYRRVRDVESELNLQNLSPEDALRRLVEFTFDHHLHHENYIRLVMSENINRGQYMARSQRIQDLNVPAIAAIRDLYLRGVEAGVFRTGLDPVDIHASISALSFFNVANRHTFGTIFKLDMQSPAYIAQRRANVSEMVVRFVRK